MGRDLWVNAEENGQDKIGIWWGRGKNDAIVELLNIVRV
jgi:hypothetical protein